jgi:hypothetical protein
MTSAVIELRRHFDSTAWQIASHLARPGSTLLITWTVEPEPVDAGIPPTVRTVLAEALCDLGPCWFAGDEEPGATATLLLRRKLASRRAFIFRADRPDELLPAFESGAHDWSMAAQWIVVAARDRADAEPADLVRSLLENWKIPAAWPAAVLAIIQAGADGDAAGCHFRTMEIEQEMRAAVERRANARGIAIRTID